MSNQALQIRNAAPNLAKTAAPADMSAIEQVLITGDLSKLTPEQRVTYYNRTCESLKLNPLTRPFDYLMLNSKLVLYARRDCADQLRRNQGISIKIVSREKVDDLYVVTAQASTPAGRCDESIGAVPLGPGVKGENLANALMKGETKAKRRVTLSICGLGMLDETELDTIKGARRVTVTQDGEIIEDGGSYDAPVRMHYEATEATQEDAPASDPAEAADRLGSAMADARTLASLKAYGLEVKKANLPAEDKVRLSTVYIAAEKRIKAAAGVSNG